MTYKPSAAELAAAKDLGVKPPTSAAAGRKLLQQDAQSKAQVAAGIKLSPSLSSGFNLVGSGSKTPGVQVPSDLSGQSIPWAEPGQATFQLKGETPGKGNGASTVTYAQLIAGFRNLTTAQRQDIQRNLYQGGFYSGTSIPKMDGTFTSADLTAIQAAALQSFNTGIPMMTLLIHGAQAGSLIQQVTADNQGIASAQRAAQAVSAPPVAYTDPNVIKQAFQAAMESIGVGISDPSQADAFVNAFHQAEVSAVSNEVYAEKQDQLSGVGVLTKSRDLALAGNAAGAATAAAQPGPVYVADRTTPNLDAEAMAQAKASDPAQYYATQGSYLGQMLINWMTNRGANGQTAPKAPSQTAPSGGILGTPLIAGPGGG